MCRNSFTIFGSLSLTQKGGVATCPYCGFNTIVPMDIAVDTAVNRVALLYPSYFVEVQEKISQLGD